MPVFDSADCDALKTAVTHCRKKKENPWGTRGIFIYRRSVASNAGPTTALAIHDNATPLPGKREWYAAEHDQLVLVNLDNYTIQLSRTGPTTPTRPHKLNVPCLPGDG